MATVLQFGEGNFIRSFIDYLIQIRQDASGDGESVVIVTPIDNPNWEIFRKRNCLYHTEFFFPLPKVARFRREKKTSS